MRTRQLAILVLLPFLWLVIASCAPHADVHHGPEAVVSIQDSGHCHHEAEPHEHDYFTALPTSVAPLPVAEPVAVQPHHPLSVEPVQGSSPRSRTGRTVLIDLSIART
ncbi:hypothetical protein [Kibdelosporangium phytohabitans]|uniref:Cobalt transporter n=1 Tax=Kibdelosporangium phytohabitans TaxID=860235 RepID=A0A0N9I5I3_9PSEU|nr:hypothetical protein [Kibdelosporangium phytohabitans]ALG11366.1 hypothetical protein AOZ06_34870 [Kibdelosporangium phytohabitans]MBE1462688.1 hypothetical protein [Kibdelosporangium phytohabitans]